MEPLDLSALDVRLPPVRRPAGYRRQAALVAVGMVALPLVYIALLAALVWAEVWYARHGPALLDAISGWPFLFAYVAPLFVGAVVLVFLVKPLFAQAARRGEPVTLRRADEPTLFAFADTLATAVGAPAPQRIDVDVQANASASFRRGVLSMGSQDLVLTLGLPLADGLSVRQFAGVLAHEYGHFTQGAGMRLTYLVPAVSRWFERVVYERDRLDVWLDEALGSAHNLWWGIALRLAAAAVTAGRWVLKGLMLAGRRMSRSLLRQMEFDADGFEVRVAGADAFRATTERLAVLHLALDGALGDVDRLRREGRLPDDLPALAAATEAALPEGVRQQVLDGVHAARTGPLDTHPAPAERIAAAERIGGAGLALPDAPARALFADFDALSARATRALYDAAVGDQMSRIEVVPTATALAERADEDAAFQALDRLLGPARVLPDAPPEIPAEPPAAPAAALGRARERCLTLAASIAEVAPGWADALCARRGLVAADALLRGKAAFDPAVYGLEAASHAAIAAQKEALTAEIDRHEAAIDAFSDAVGGFVGLGLSLLPPADRAAADAWVAALRVLHDLHDEIGTLSDDLAAAWALVEAYQAKPGAEHLAHRAEDLLDAIHGRLGRVRRALHAVPYPSPQAGADVSLGTFVLTEVPSRQDGIGTLQAAAAVEAALPEIRARAWAALAAAAERAEALVEAGA